MQAAARHVDGLDLRRRTKLDRLVVAVADLEVVLDDAPERRERKPEGHQWPLRLVAHVNHKPPLMGGQHQMIGPRHAVAQCKAVVLDEVVDGGVAFVLGLR